MSGRHDWTLNGPADPKQAKAELSRLEELEELRRLVRAYPAEAFTLAMAEVAAGRLVLRAAGG